jgi:hypothetical protein
MTMHIIYSISRIRQHIEGRGGHVPLGLKRRRRRVTSQVVVVTIHLL